MIHKNFLKYKVSKYTLLSSFSWAYIEEMLDKEYSITSLINRLFYYNSSLRKECFGIPSSFS